MVELIVEDPTITSNQDKLMTSGAQQLMLCLYKNQLMHIFVDVAMIAISINSCAQDTLHIEELKKHYKFLERLLNIDFIFLPGNTDKDFEQAMLVLTHTCGVVVENSHVQIRKSTNKYTTFFSQMFDPFLLGYWIMCRCLKSMQTGAHGKPLAKPPKVITKEAQNLSATLLRMGAFKHMEVLSLDMMNNGLQSLYHMGAVQKDKRMYPNEVILSQIMDELISVVMNVVVIVVVVSMVVIVEMDVVVMDVVVVVVVMNVVVSVVINVVVIVVMDVVMNMVVIVVMDMVVSVVVIVEMDVVVMDVVVSVVLIVANDVVVSMVVIVEMDVVVSVVMDMVVIVEMDVG
ncbi:hypothetical protein CHS0354_014567 [Potamilus streckersoni]|uniref:GPAT/DHAPAT C-terminal domain-containing protein n=1 Tax=Potamilus streckersoni TaxID=2493646 RepID=A0AAE0RNN0_9BIVA|nr:hypothetical protein CHS0354_014567 [Potamilus streckersoni]